MRGLVVVLFLFGSAILNQAFADILLNKCRVSSIYNLEIDRMQKNKNKIMEKCIKQTVIDPERRCREDYDFVLGVRNRGLVNTTQFYNSYDWKNTEIKIYNDNSKLASAISSTMPWPFWGAVIPTNLVNHAVTPGGGTERAYEEYATDDLRNSANIGPGYSRNYDFFRIHIQTSVDKYGEIDISIFTFLKTKSKTAVMRLNDRFLTFECNIQYMN